MASGSDRDLRRRFNRDPRPTSDAGNSVISPNPPSLPPLRSLGARVRSAVASSAGSGFRSSRYRPGDRPMERHRSSFRIPPPFDELDRSLEDPNSQLRALLDSTNSVLNPRRMPSALTQSSDMAEENRRVKRRKLDSDRIVSSFPGFRYGRYGQVEPGQLTMEIVSCDGGLFPDEKTRPPENILKNDGSVYCTKGNRCNIILKHQGGTVFSLKELIIKAPGSNYTCPVREGMVFVAMESDALLTRTAQYQIQHLPRSQRRGATVIIRREEDGRSVTHLVSQTMRPFPYGAEDDEDDDDDDDGDDNDDDDDDDDDDDNYRTAQIPPEFTVSPPPFNITTECSDDQSDTDNEQRRRPPRRRTPNRIGALPFESGSSDEDADESSWGRQTIPRDLYPYDDLADRAYRVSQRRGGIGGGDQPGGSRGRASGMTLEEAQEASQIATQEAVRAVGGELMAPLAHFFIEKEKNKCTIRFDPPVSGRFILLKMWSPYYDQQDRHRNIDIQAVIAKGFAGPRYFPAVELA
ncbi:hypothetical protein MMYC01_204964 [Madurella mycetomatis]|uniref:Eukaryotic translation initiation factor 6 n=1 Tax=Madurella mycetomatis TaxID=100816 RepID=A0A175W494_9PEZI|nr:hypothetical protein MMYC01_210533 [Madurella mycetomatis]KXX78548.1 hypothetical protein MMYC01_204964 [Madurella mycetomatis]